MKKILLLGTSFSSMEIVQKAKQRGLYTIVTDTTPYAESPVKQAADEYWMISTAQKDRLIEKCRKESIGAIFAGISEFNLDRVLIMTQELGLPCYINAKAWEYARNKRLFKNKCIEKGVPVVPEYSVPDSDDEAAWEKIKYPVVIKPVDGWANTGLSICYNRNDVEEGLRKVKAISTNPDFILEKYITGEETWNYYFFAEGVARYVYSGTVFRQPGYPTFLYSFGTSAVAGIDDYLEKMNPQIIELLTDIGCREGIAWIQCIREDNGNYYALEMAHRMSADTVGDILEKSLGFNSVDWLLDTALGCKHTADMLPAQAKRPYSGATCVYYLFSDHSGRIEKMSGFEKLDPDCFYVEYAKKPGDDVGQYSMMVKIVFFARNTGQMCNLIQQLNDTIDISDTDGNDLIVHFTDYKMVKERLSELMCE